MADEKNKRIEELKSKLNNGMGISIDEFFELRILDPSVNLIDIGNPQDVKIPISNNLEICFKKFSQAYALGFYFECFDNAIYIMDFLIRLYLFRKGASFQPKQTFEFGKLLKQCEGKMDLKMLNKLKQFNRARIKAIHRFLIEDIRYNDLKIELDSFLKLYKEFGNFMAKEIGKKF